MGGVCRDSNIPYCYYDALPPPPCKYHNIKRTEIFASAAGLMCFENALREGRDRDTERGGHSTNIFSRQRYKKCPEELHLASVGCVY